MTELTAPHVRMVRFDQVKVGDRVRASGGWSPITAVEPVAWAADGVTVALLKLTAQHPLGRRSHHVGEPHLRIKVYVKGPAP